MGPGLHPQYTRADFGQEAVGGPSNSTSTTQRRRTRNASMRSEPNDMQEPNDAQERMQLSQAGRVKLTECFRCGRIGHIRAGCSAKTHINGRHQSLRRKTKVLEFSRTKKKRPHKMCHWTRNWIKWETQKLTGNVVNFHCVLNQHLENLFESFIQLISFCNSCFSPVSSRIVS